MNRWQKAALGGLAAAGILAQVVEPGHGWEAVPGSFALFGAAGCLLLMAVAKGLAKAGISRAPDYYRRLRQRGRTSGDDRD